MIGNLHLSLGAPGARVGPGLEGGGLPNANPGVEPGATPDEDPAPDTRGE